MDFSKQYSGEFNKTNFENHCFAWEFNIKYYKTNEIFISTKISSLIMFSIFFVQK